MQWLTTNLASAGSDGFYTSCSGPQLEYVQEEQQFLQDEYSATQARLAELAQVC